jgi:hypothetical protein
MTTILLICSVALNILLFVWALVLWNVKDQWYSVAMDWKKLALIHRDSATSESPSTPATSTESPTPANDAD